MRIAYIGNFSQRHCTEVHLAKTLEMLGHEVIRLQENDLPESLDNFIIAGGFDLFLYTRTWGKTVELEHLEMLRERGIPSVSYHLDLYVGLQRKYLHENKTLEEILKTDPFWRTDFVFTPDGDPASAEVFEQAGVKHYYMKPGVFKPECVIATPSAEFIEDRATDVLFVGGGARPGDPDAYGHPEWNYRNELIAWLMDTYGEQFTKFGHPQETIRNELLNAQYAISKVVVGDSVCIGFNHKNYWSDRVYETIGRGGFLIHPYIEGLEEEFTDGENIVFYEYGNWVQLQEKIDYYLEHDEEREKIRLAGHELVKAKCTYTDRLTQMLLIITKSGAFDHPSVVPKNPYGEGIVEAKPKKINLGAGLEPTEGWVNVDWIEGKGIDVIHNLFEYPWPFGDGVADEIKAIDVLEHMPPDQSIGFIKECWRILQPNGKLTIQVPHYASNKLWIDPTHYRGYAPESFDYFDPEKDYGKWYRYYSDKKFTVNAEVQYARPDKQAVGNITFTMVKI